MTYRQLSNAPSLPVAPASRAGLQVTHPHHDEHRAGRNRGAFSVDGDGPAPGPAR